MTVESTAVTPLHSPLCYLINFRAAWVHLQGDVTITSCAEPLLCADSGNTSVKNLEIYHIQGGCSAGRMLTCSERGTTLMQYCSRVWRSVTCRQLNCALSGNTSSGEPVLVNPPGRLTHSSLQSLMWSVLTIKAFTVNILNPYVFSWDLGSEIMQNQGLFP